MISNDTIHVQAKGGKNNNVESISTLEVDDCLCVVHDVWWCAKPAFVTYKWPQSKQGTHKHSWWDGWAPNVGINDWGITHGLWSRKGVECVDELNVTKETRWSKVDALGIIGWKDEDVSWQSIQIIMISKSCCDTYRRFDDNETVGLAMPMLTN